MGDLDLPDLPEKLVGRYALGERLGAGGAGVVYLAEDRLRLMPIALKLLRPDRSAKQARLHEEFSLLASLNHPGVVAVHDLGLVDGVLYMATELVEGERLDHWLAEQPSCDRVLRVFVDLLATLAWLHSEGIVHADIKPGNVIVKCPQDGTPWPVLIDFGLATMQDQRRLLGGTAGYQAPELRGSRPALPTPSTDLYALGRCFQPWLDQASVPEAEPLRKLVLSLTQTTPSERPPSADAALRALRSERGEAPRRLGARMSHAFWGRAPEAVVQRVIDGTFLQRVRLPKGNDAQAFLVAVQRGLQLRGQAALFVPLTLRGGALWDRVLPCLTGVPAPARPPSAAPEHHPDLLEAWSLSVLEQLRRVSAPMPVLLIPQLGTLAATARLVLKRALEAGLCPPIVTAGVSQEQLTLGLPSESEYEETVLPVPDEVALRSFLDVHRIAQPPPEVCRLLTARLRVGPVALRLQLDLWARRRVLDYDPDSGWTWAQAVDPAEVDAPDLDDLWRGMWEALDRRGRALLAHLMALGGAADVAELAVLVSGDLRGDLARLSADGWISLEAAGHVSCRPGPLRRLKRAVFGMDAPDQLLRGRYVALLEPPHGAERVSALTAHLEALGHHTKAALVWANHSLDLEQSLEAVAASAAAMAAARAYAAAGVPARALELGERAARLSLASNQSDLELISELVNQAAEALDEPMARMRAAVLAARVAVQCSQPQVALDAIAKTRRRQEAHGHRLPTRVRFDLNLAEGTARAQLGQRDGGAESLGRALVLAESLGDDHMVGRVANNLGILEFDRGDFGAAAEAWQRAASAKQRAGDLRGERIAASNRGLALRELGRLSEAAEAAEQALSAARRMGDRRGRVMGQLALAQLWLDLGAVEGAREALDEAQALPLSSAIVSADLALLGARLDLALGENTRAAVGAAAVHAQGAERRLASVVAEAWALCYSAAQRDERVLESKQVRACLGKEPQREAAALRAGAGRDSVWLAACELHAVAVAGDWVEGRVSAEALVAELVPPDGVLAPPLVPALELTLGAVVVMGLVGLEDRLEDAVKATVNARYDALCSLRAMVVSGDDLVDRGTLARRLGFESCVFEVSESAQNLHENLKHSNGSVNRRVDAAQDPAMTELASSPKDTLVTQVLARMTPSELAKPEAWVEALRQSMDAQHCELHPPAQGEAIAVAHADGLVPLSEGARWKTLSRRLSPKQNRFIARGAEGVEFMGLQLAGAGGAMSGALWLAWEPASGRDWSEASGLDVIQGLLGLLAASHVGRADLMETQQALDATRQMNARLIAEHAAEVTALKDALQQSRHDESLRHEYGSIVYRSPVMRRVLAVVDKVTDTDLPLLVLGDSGVGKELLARAVHMNGPRSKGPFVAENCGAIPAELFESTFFGHVRGAFTGAHLPRKGLLEQARGGTLFLDELGELRPDHQVKLLRALQERRFRPVGAPREIEAEFRLVTATNRNLEAMVSEGSFRQDLYFRVAVVTVAVPPLRERPEDILALAEHFLAHHSRRLERELSLTVGAADVLSAYAWPGNVRELENEMLRATALMDSDRLRAKHLSPRLQRPVARRAEHASGHAMTWQGERLDAVLARVEREVLRMALERCEGKKAPTARVLGLSRPGLDGKLSRLGIDSGAIREAARRRKRAGSDKV